MIWYGNAGHFCNSRKCRFHLCTEVNGYVISTIGEYYPTSEKEMERLGVGSKDFYETLVYSVSGDRCKCGCNQPNYSASTIEMVRYATPKEANEGHIKLCEKYEKIESPEAKRIRQENCQHIWKPTFLGGDTYFCSECGKEIDMTEDESP
jgi:hypothetical protein